MKTRKATAYLVAAILSIAAAPAKEAHDWRPSAKAKRGDVVNFIRANRYMVLDPSCVVEGPQFMFDGDRWINLNTPEGLKLYLDVQHEQDPGMLE